MKNKILLCITIFLSVLFIGVVVNKKNHSFLNEDKTIKVKTKEEQIEELKIEDYVTGVIAGEMPASFEIEALKAQAVASRSYAMYKILHNKDENYDVLSNITHQVYLTEEEMQEKWGQDYTYYLNKIKNAVNETKNEVMYYNDEIIEAFYFSMSNGSTEDAKSVFEEDLPYIKAVSSSWDNESLNNFIVTTSFTKDDFCIKLKLENCQSIKIDNINYSASHRINNLTINNQEFKGTEIRTLLNLRSTDISFEIRENEILITTRGYGHGVGMSQYGANGMAKDGYDYKQILNHYYNDITINKMV